MNTALQTKLSDIERDLATKRGERAVAARERNAAKEAFSKMSGYSTSSPEYRAAKAATDRVQSLDEEIAEIQASQVGTLKLLGSREGSRPTDPSQIDINKAGGWLARQVRLKAIGLDDVGTINDAAAFLDRLRERSALMSSGPTLLDVDVSETRLPILTGRMTPAVPVPELDPIPIGDPPVGNVTVKCPKYAKLTVLSLEAFRDARPVVLAGLERELVSSISEGFDLACFDGAAGSAQTGLLHTTGTIGVDATAGWSNLDPFITAAASLRAAGATATAIYINPNDYAIASRMKKATGSNEPLISGLRSATDRPAEDIVGIPVYQSIGVPLHKAIMAQANELLVVRRSDVEVAVDEGYEFASAGVGIRVISRLALVVGQPTAVAVISLPVA